jgi:hypothetical protein
MAVLETTVRATVIGFTHREDAEAFRQEFVGQSGRSSNIG